MEQDTAGQSHEMRPPGVGPSHQPVQEGERIEALDVLRGFALLGIFMVNIQLFSLPLMEAMGLLTLGEAPPGEVWGWVFIRTFCELKFVSLFSLLFGMGLIVQMTRARARGKAFGLYYLRRTGVLAIFGLVHALLLWYGDILFLYACVSLLLFALCRLSAKTLMAICMSLVVISIVVATAMSSLEVIIAQWQTSSPSAAQVAPPEMSDPESEGDSSAGQADTDQAEALTPDMTEPTDPEPSIDNEPEPEAEKALDSEVASPARGFEAITRGQFDPANEHWIAGERLAYREGPFFDVFVFRGLSYIYIFMGGLLGYGWHVLAMFLLGAALIKLNFFAAERRHWHRRLFLIGLGLGLAVEFASTGIYLIFDFDLGWWVIAATALHELGSFTLCLGYVGGMTLLVNSGILRGLTRAMACVGRMALSNYIGQTVIATVFMYWWGLGWFGEVSRPQMIGLVIAIYAGQLIVSTIWLNFFRIGPLEWLWRSLTYLKFQPILRKK